MLEKGEFREKNLKISDYFDQGYFSLEQLFSYAFQINHVYSLNPVDIFEIGIGNGIFSDYFRKAGYKIYTNDINLNLKPNYNYPITDLSKFVKNIDLIVCCEVLEHVDFSYFEKIIMEFSRAGKRLYLTLPNYKQSFGFDLRLRIPKFKNISLNFFVFIKRKKILNEHFWELGTSKKNSKSSVLKILKKYYCSVETGYYPQHTYHQFFICSN